MGEEANGVHGVVFCSSFSVVQCDKLYPMIFYISDWYIHSRYSSILCSLLFKLVEAMIFLFNAGRSLVSILVSIYIYVVLPVDLLRIAMIMNISFSSPFL